MILPRQVLYVLKKLERLPMSLEILHETGVGKTVNSYRKHPQPVGERAREVVTRWKGLLADQPQQDVTVSTP